MNPFKWSYSTLVLLVLIFILISFIGKARNDGVLEGLKNGIDHVYTSCKLLGFHYHMDGETVLACMPLNKSDYPNLPEQVEKNENHQNIF